MTDLNGLLSIEYDLEEIETFKIQNKSSNTSTIAVPKDHPSGATFIFHHSESNNYTWYRHGQVHNAVGPAIHDGKSMGFYQFGLLHRKDGIAYYDPVNGDYMWAIRNRLLNADEILKWYKEYEIDLLPDLSPEDKLIYGMKYGNNREMNFLSR